MSQVDVSGIGGINVGAALCGLEINVGHLAVVAHMLPEHLSLVVAQVYAVYVPTSVFTLQVSFGALCETIWYVKKEYCYY